MKFLRFLLVIVLLLGLAVVVVNFMMDRRGGTIVPSQTENGESTVSSDPTEPSENAEPSESTAPTISDDTTAPSDPPAEVLPMDQLRPMGSFHENRLFVERKSDGAVLCIDKQGQILFKLQSGYVPYRLSNSRFYNGLAIVSTNTQESMLHLCTADGRIIRPEDFGGTEFWFGPLSSAAQQERLFADGYIMVVNGNRMGLLDSNLSWVVPMSMEYRQQVLGFAAGMTDADLEVEIYYGGGMLLSKAGYLDLLTGQKGLITDLPVVPGYKSDYWRALWGANTIMYLNNLSEGFVLALNMEAYLGPLMESGASVPKPLYKDGLAGILAIQDTGNSFVLMDEDGGLCFEPVQVLGDTFVYDSATGLYCVSGNDGAGVLHIQIFDKNGLVNSYTYSIPEGSEHSVASLEDGVLMICNRFGESQSYETLWELYSLNFEPLYK